MMAIARSLRQLEDRAAGHVVVDDPVDKPSSESHWRMNS
jgi:hypothetical protein